MSRQKKSVQGIASVYRALTIDAIMFGHVRARLRCQASPSIMDAIYDFLNEYDLDDLDPQVAYQIYQRMQAKFRENAGAL